MQLSSPTSPGCTPAFLPRGGRCPEPKPQPTPTLNPQPVGELLLLALGVLVGPEREHQFRTSFRQVVPEQVVWRFVVSHASNRRTHNDESKVLTVPCPDGEEVKHLACFCKTVWWFHKALELFPRTHFFGKVEDDTIVHVGRLLHELQWVVRSTSADAMVWYGHFQWAVHRRVPLLRPGQHIRARTGLHGSGVSTHFGLKGRWCTDGDELLDRKGPEMCEEVRSDATVAPFASGAIDVRSRSLATHIDRCDLLWRREWAGASCDGPQGYFMVHCLPEQMSLMHLPTLKVCSGPIRGSLVRMQGS